MTRRRTRQIAIIVTLTLVASVMGALYLNYRATKKLSFDIAPQASDAIDPPQYLYSFSGTAQQRLLRPLGVLVADERVYVADSRQGLVYVFRLDGTFVSTFGKDKLVTPLYIAKEPRTGELWVSDRRNRSIEVFSSDGKWLRRFDPKLPKDQLPKFETGGTQWAPVAIAFAPDGRLYVTEILKGHRLLVFDDRKRFEKSVGTAGLVTDSSKGPEHFQFPNSLKVHGDEVWVSDSNNRRIQVFDLSGKYERIVATEGLPRGFDFLPKGAGGVTRGPGRLVLVDTLAHDATIWGDNGKKFVTFGAQGVLEGQFSYPNDLSVGPRARIYITDTSNGRVQVWGWPENINPVPIPRIPQNWGWCLTPLLLLPLLLLARKRRFYATADFIDSMLDADLVYAMPGRRRRWLVSEATYERFKSVVRDEVDLGELLHVDDFSESDVQALSERLEIDHSTAAELAMAKRAHLMCNEDGELRRYARVLEIEVVDHHEFIERFPAERKAEG